MSIKPISVPPKKLTASMTSSTLTLQLGDIKQWDGVTDLVAGDFGTVIYAVLRDSTNSLVEIIELDASTIANAITTGATILKRGLPFDGGLTEVDANKLTWVKNETTVELGSNPPQLLDQFVRRSSSGTIDDLLQYTSVLTPTDDRHLATKKYVDDTAFGGTITFDQLVPSATAGETVAAGDLLYLNETDGEWYHTDADTVSTFEERILGIAQGAGTNGAAITGGVLLSGVDKNQSGMVTGEPMYVSNTPGQIANSAGTNERVIGVARSATDLYFNPFYKNVPTGDEKNALAGGGDFGDPSATNQFITQDFLGTRTPQIVTFDASGTWTKDAGLLYVIVEGVGAGGGGGGAIDSGGGDGLGAMPGASGGYFRKVILASALGATETVTIGAGGTAGSAGGNGGNGGTTSFGSHCQSTGGTGGLGSWGDGSGAFVAGGVATGGDINIDGNRPISGGTDGTDNGNEDPIPGGRTPSVLGSKGYGGQCGSLNLGDNGEAGAAGFIVVTEFYS